MNRRTGRRRRIGAGSATALATVLTAVVMGTTTAAPAATAAPAGWTAGADGGAHVTVRADQPLSEFAPGAMGVNTPIWNPRLTDPQIPGLLWRAGISRLEFNGGGVSDLYHWRDGSLSHDPDAAHHPYDYYSLKPQFSLDEFAQRAHVVGAQMLVHVNYGTGTPEEAADWVRDANVVKHDGVRDWAIGEEVWGNGSITNPSINFEPDAHADKSPTAYGRNVVQFARAMKAADPSIRVGIELIGIPGGVFRQWDEAALTEAGAVVDFVDIHRYPFGQSDKSDAALFAVPRRIPADLAALRDLIGRHTGTPGHHVDVVVGEANSAIYPAPQQISAFNALYLADNNLTLLENGARSIAWYALHNGGYPDTRGDLGLLSTGDCNKEKTVCAPSADTPFPPYYGMQIVGRLTRAGGQLMAVTSDNGLVVGHAIRRPGGALAVVLINEDPKRHQRIRFDLRGYSPACGLTSLNYARGDDGVHVRHEAGCRRDQRTLPPYSITALLLRPAHSGSAPVSGHDGGEARR